MEIHQLLPNLSYGDAISNHALEIQKILKKCGYRSNIYTQHADPEVKKFSNPYEKHKKVSSRKNILIFHYSIGSKMFQYIFDAPDKKIMIYHNITPHSFFKNFNNHLYFLTKSGRERLNSFCNIPYLSIADSEYNAGELRKLGFKNVNVLPVIIDFQNFKRPPSKSILEKYNSRYTNIIFVGRIVPNKKYEDIIKSFYFYKKNINNKSRLFLIGSYTGMESYFNSLKELVDNLDIDDVIFTGRVTGEELIAYYQLADIFLCLSEHEGFCVPLLEAMYFKIPIIAYSSTGVPGTLSKAGILIGNKNYIEIAELIDVVINDKQIRESMIKNQIERLAEFRKDEIEDKFIEYVKKVL